MSQVYQLLRARRAGWLVPKYQHAFGQCPIGVLAVHEAHVPDLNRHSIVARLRDPATGAPVAGVLDLYDVVLRHWSCDAITLTGFEGVPDDLGLKVTDCAQTWVLRPAEM